MSWSDPAGHVWTTGETVTAANMNTYIRLNLEETCPDTATTAGDMVYADAANSMGSRLAIGAAHGLLVSTASAPVWRIPAFDTISEAKTSTKTSYTTLGGVDWAFSSEVEVTVTTGTRALVLFGAKISNNSAGSVTNLGYSISGATTASASAGIRAAYESSANADVAEFSTFYYPTLTAGSNTFTLEGYVSAGTGTITNPRILVIPL